jgi:predicted transposase YbfD/YdcC
MPKSLLEIFDSVPDPRSEKNRRYPLDEVLFLCVCAVISGAEGWSGIAQFGQAKLDWFRRFLPFENGIPNEDSIAWIIGRLNVEAFQACFIEWVQGIASEFKGEVIAIDGKTARRSHHRSQGKNPLHMVSAWACQQRLSLAQVATEEKSNEITAIPALLDLLDIKNALITIDAMGCQKDIAEKIVKKQGDYVLALKGNQGQLHEAVVDYFQTAQMNNYANVEIQKKQHVDSGHGRIETRTHYLVTDLSTLPNVSDWAGLRSIGWVEAKREEKATGKTSTEHRYYINSITDIDVFSKATRAHWGVENGLHWVLDMVFREDESRIRQGSTPIIFNQFRQLANNLLRQVSSKLSIKARRFQAALDDRFREKVIFQGENV